MRRPTKDTVETAFWLLLLATAFIVEGLWKGWLYAVLLLFVVGVMTLVVDGLKWLARKIGR